MVCEILTSKVAEPMTSKIAIICKGTFAGANFLKKMMYYFSAP